MVFRAWKIIRQSNTDQSQCCPEAKALCPMEHSQASSVKVCWPTEGLLVFLGPLWKPVGLHGECPSPQRDILRDDFRIIIAACLISERCCVVADYLLTRYIHLKTWRLCISAITLLCTHALPRKQHTPSPDPNHRNGRKNRKSVECYSRNYSGCSIELCLYGDYYHCTGYTIRYCQD